jgi:hypothetical protein
LPDQNDTLQNQLDADIEKVSSLLVLVKDDVEALRLTLDLLKTSSNAGFGETLVAQCIRKFENAILNLEARTEGYEHEILRTLRKIQHRLEPTFTISITLKENSMAIGSLSSPGTAALFLALLDNGSPFTPPPGSTYVFTPTLTASDSSVTIAADPTTPEQFDVTIPAGDTSTSVTFTGLATAPDDTTATGTLTIPFAATPQKFSISVTQTS